MRGLYQIIRSPLGIAAALSVTVLVGVSASRVASTVDATAQATTYVAQNPSPQTVNAGGADWQQEMILLGLATSTSHSATSSIDQLSMIGPEVMAQLQGVYAGLQQQGTYSSSTAQQAADEIASNVRGFVTYQTYSASDIRTDTDTSYARMLKYRADLQLTLAPLLKNTTPEIEIFGRYTQSGDPSYLVQLKQIAQNYRDAANATALVVTPQDAVNYQRDILNAMQEFAATMDAMATHASDPLASVALLRTYNQAEQDMLNSFNALAQYYAQKKS